MGLLSGLEKMGLGKLQNVDLYEKPEEKKEEKKEQKEEQKETKAEVKAPEVREQDCIFDRLYDCPVCGGKKARGKTVKSGKTRLVRQDVDLCAVYEPFDPLKYDVISCPECGYTALARYFKTITPVQIKLIKENIAMSFQPSEEEDLREIYTYEDALERYKLSLVNTVVKKGKASEKAYTCLKTGWLLRSYRNSLGEEADEAKKKELKEQEREFLKNALDGFVTARQTEDYPMCGMDEITVEYLIGVLAMEFEQYDVASKMISSVLVSPNANARMKDRARDVNDMIVAKSKKS